MSDFEEIMRSLGEAVAGSLPESMQNSWSENADGATDLAQIASDAAQSGNDITHAPGAAAAGVVGGVAQATISSFEDAVDWSDQNFVSVSIADDGMPEATAVDNPGADGPTFGGSLTASGPGIQVSGKADELNGAVAATFNNVMDGVELGMAWYSAVQNFGDEAVATAAAGVTAFIEGGASAGEGNAGEGDATANSSEAATGADGAEVTGSDTASPGSSDAGDTASGAGGMCSAPDSGSDPASTGSSDAGDTASGAGGMCLAPDSGSDPASTSSSDAGSSYADGGMSGGEADGGTADGGNADGGNADGGNADGGNADGGSDASQGGGDDTSGYQGGGDDTSGYQGGGDDTSGSYQGSG